MRYPTARSALKALIGDIPEDLVVGDDVEMQVVVKQRKGGKPLPSRLLEPIVAQVLSDLAPRPLILKSRPPSKPPASASIDGGVAGASALGVAMRRRRQSLQLTQQQLADRAAVGRRFIVDLERGKPTLEIGKILSVAKALGLALAVRVADDA